MQRFVHSKWKKTQVLRTDPKVNAHIPHTEKLTRENLGAMLSRYGMVYVKPDRGTFGNGVMRVERTEEGFRYQTGTVVRSFGDLNGLYADLLKVTKRRGYLVQKGIHLLKHRGRRFDIRVMVQTKPGGGWEATGIVGRVAHPSKIVTNFHNGGTLKDISILLAPYLTQEELRRFSQEIKQLGLRVARKLDGRFPGIKEVGLDIAVDQSIRPWILEVNTCPDPYIFKVLKDKSIQRKILRYARAYGRIKMTQK